MASAFLQYLFSGITLGAIYALAGLGFSIIYNASHVINFAQGEFLLIGGMATFSLVASAWTSTTTSSRSTSSPATKGRT